MTTTGSYSDKDRFLFTFRSAFKGHIPLAVATAVLLFLIIPLPFVVEISSYTPVDYYRYYKNMAYSGIYTDEDFSGFVNMALTAASVAAALYATGYMHSKRQVDLYHSLPITRPHLLSARMLASCVAVLGPYVLISLLTQLMQVPFYAFNGVLGVEYFLFNLVDLAVQVANVLLVYTFVVLIAVNVGKVFDGLIVSAVVGFVFLVLFLLCGSYWESATYGAVFSAADYALLLSPFTFIYFRFAFPLYSAISESLLMLFLLAGALAVSAGFYFASLECYKRRKSEMAGQTLPRGILQIGVKAACAFCGGLCFYFILEPENIATRFLAVAFGAAIFGFIAEIVMSRNLHYLFYNLRWIGAAGAACLVFLLVVSYDLLGVENRVPNVNQVQYVSINYRGRYEDIMPTPIYYDIRDKSTYGYRYNFRDRAGVVRLASQDSVRLVTDAHRSLLRDRYDRLEDKTDQRTYYNQQITLEYRMINGTTLYRQYSSVSNEAYRILAGLEQEDGFLQQNHPVFRNGGQEMLQEDMIRDIIEFHDSYGYLSSSVRLNRWERRDLLEAVRQDTVEEATQESITSPRTAVGYLEIQYKYYTETENSNPTKYTALLPVLPTHTRTLELLERLGVDVVESNLWVPLEAAFLVAPDERAVGNRNRVAVLTPDNMWKLNTYPGEFHNSYDVLAYTDHIDTLLQLEEGAVNQILLGDDPEEEGIVQVYFQVDGKVGCCKYIRFEDLPLSMQKELRLSGQYQ